MMFIRLFNNTNYLRMINIYVKTGGFLVIPCKGTFEIR